MNRLLLPLILFYSTAFSLDVDCEAGHNAFRTTVFEKITRDCKGCHKGSHPQAPAFASEDSSKSYPSLLRYVDFHHIERSVLTIRAGNDHCKLPNCNAASGREMATLIQQWWDQGEKDCKRNGKFFTQEIPIPTSLPADPAKFSLLRWDLSTVSTELKGTFLQVEAQQFIRATELNPGAYRFRRPRFIGGTRPLKVKDLKILINGKFDLLSNAYTSIDQTVSPQNTVHENIYPVLSSHTLLVLQDLAEGDRVSASFEILSPSEPTECKAVEDFKERVYSTWKNENCFQCHGGPGVAGVLPANTHFPMSGDLRSLCNSARQRLQWNMLVHSPLWANASGKESEHPALKNVPDTLQAWAVWASKETPQK